MPFVTDCAIKLTQIKTLVSPGLTSTTTNLRAAHSLEDMQQIARNQITHKIYELQERIEYLKALRGQVDNIVDWASYEQITADVAACGDDADLTALRELGQEIGTMRAGNYF